MARTYLSHRFVEIGSFLNIVDNSSLVPGSTVFVGLCASICVSTCASDSGRSHICVSQKGEHQSDLVSVNIVFSFQ